MASQTIQKMDSDLITKINDLVYERDGHKFIRLGNYALDFKKEFAFLGFTKSQTKVILGDIYKCGPDGMKCTKRYAKIEKGYLVTDGWQYSEKLIEVIN